MSVRRDCGASRRTARSDRRFPLQRFVTADWTSPITNKLLLEASGIHRVERWGNMHLQTGKGDNIDAHRAGHHVGRPTTRNPVTGGSLTYRSAAQFNNSWNWNIHYRVAASYITGSHNFKVGLQQRLPAPREHDLHRPDDAVQLQLRQRRARRRSSTASRRAPIAVNVDYDMGLFAQDRWTVGRWTLHGRRPLRRVQEQLPGAVDCADVPGAEPERPVRRRSTT